MAKEKPLRGAGASHKHHGDVRQSPLGSQQRHFECRQMEDGNALVSRKTARDGGLLAGVFQILWQREFWDFSDDNLLF